MDTIQGWTFLSVFLGLSELHGDSTAKVDRPHTAACDGPFHAANTVLKDSPVAAEVLSHILSK